MSDLAFALVPVIGLGVAFIAYCLIDLARAETVRHLPKWAWALVIMVSIPFGGVAYLLVGRPSS